MRHLRKVVFHLFGAALALLVCFHNIVRKLGLGFVVKCADGFNRRQRLKAVFRAEAEFVPEIIGKRAEAVPYRPIVSVAAGEVSGVLEVLTGGR